MIYLTCKISKKFLKDKTHKVGVAEEIGCGNEIDLSNIERPLGYQKPCSWMGGREGGWVGGYKKPF